MDGQEEPFLNQLDDTTSSWDREMTGPDNPKLSLRETRHHLLGSYFSSEDFPLISVSYQILFPKTLAGRGSPTLQKLLPVLMKIMNRNIKINCSEARG